MAERRAIKSKIWEDEFFGELGFFDQVVWIGLFSRMADDQGRMPDNPTLISSQLFPYKFIPPMEIDASLVTFADHLIRYTVNGRSFIQIPKWWENQPMQYATPSNYPAPDGWVDRYRTNYKGSYITYNWEGTQDTQIGCLLYNKLRTLPRISNWMDYVGSLQAGKVGTLNPNPNPNYNPNPNPKDDNNNNSLNPGGEKALSLSLSLPADAAGTVYTLYETEIGELTPTVAEVVGLAIDDYSPFWVEEAIKIASLNNIRKWTYCMGILQNWKENGKDGDGKKGKPALDELTPEQRRERYTGGEFADYVVH